VILEYLESIDSAVFMNINHDLTNPLFDAVFPSLRVFTYIVWLIVILYSGVRTKRSWLFS